MKPGAVKPGGPVLDCPGEPRAHLFLAGLVVGMAIMGAAWAVCWLSQAVPT